jgi:hypothetical protein
VDLDIDRASPHGIPGLDITNFCQTVLDHRSILAKTTRFNCKTGDFLLVITVANHDPAVGSGGTVDVDD